MNKNGISSRHPASACKARASVAGAFHRRSRALAGSVAALLAGAALWLPGSAPAQVVLYNNTTQSIAGRADVGSAPPADSFSTGSSAYNLTTVTVVLDGDADGGSTTISLASNSSNAPGTHLATIGTVLDSSLTADPTFSNYTLTLGTPYALSANTTYWIVLSATDNGAQWAFSTTGAGTGVAGQSSNVSGTTSSTSQFAYLMEVQATVASGSPLPATFWLGGASGAWTGANWASDSSGTATTATPTSANGVTFSASGAMNENTTLGANFTIQSLTINDPNAVTINAGGSFTLTISGSAGTGITVNSGAGLLTIDANVAFAGSSNTITVSNTAGAIIDGVIGGSNGLTKAGSGTLTLGAANNYTGATTISAGTIQLGIANALPTGTALSVSGTLDLAGFSQQVGSVTGSGIVTDSGGAATFTVNNGSADSFGGTITGTNLSLTISGVGTLTLESANTYGGSTTIVAGGTIALGIANALPTGTSLQGGGTLDLAGFNQQVSAVTGGATTITDSGAAATFTINNSGLVNLTGELTGTNLSFTKSGTGNLYIHGVNSYGGATTISAGTIQLGIANALPTGTALSVTGTLDLNSFNQQVASVTGSGSVTDSGFAATFTVNNGSADSFAGTITGGNLSLIKSGAGTLTLGSANTYGGSTTISGGTIALGVANALPTGTALSVTGTLDLAGFNQQVVSATGAGTVTNSGSAATFTVTGGGAFSGNITGASTALTVGGFLKTLTLSGNNTYGGLTTITSSDVLKAGSATALSSATSVSDSGTLDLGGNSISIGALNGIGSVINSGALGTLSVTGGGSFSGTITGANTALTVNGASQTLTLSGGNTYGGATTISAGTLALGSTASLPVTTALSVTGTLDLAGFNQQVASLTGSGIVTDSGATANFTVNNAAADTFQGSLTGANLTFAKIGVGTLTLSGLSTYGGSTSLISGTIALGAANALPTGTTLEANATGTLDLAGFSQQVSAVLGYPNITDSGTAATFTIDNSTTDTFNGALTGTNLSFTKSGGGTLIIGVAQTGYGGATTISAGTMQLGVTNALPTGAVLSVAGEFDLAGFNQQVSSVTGSGTVTSSTGAATFTVNNASADTFAGSISGTGLSLTKTGVGTLTLSGSNTYAGVTTVSAGTLSVSSLANGGSASNIGAATNAASNLVLNGGTLQYTGNSVTIDRGFTASDRSVIDVSTSGQTLTISGAVNVNGGGSGASGLTIEGNLTLTGAVSLDDIPNSNNALNIAAGATLTTSGTVTNPAGNNVFQGGTLIVDGGTFTTSAITALGNATGISGSTLTVSSGVFDQTTGAGSQFLLGQAAAGTLNLNGGTFETAVQLLSGVGGNALNFNGGTLQLSASLTNLVSVPTDVTMTVNSGGAVIDVNGFNLTISNALLAGSGSGGLTVNSTAGGGTLTLSGPSTYTGATTINAGTIALGIANALPTGTALSVTGTLDLAGWSQEVGSVTGSGTVTGSGSSIFTVNNATSDSFAGTISGTNLALVKQGAGALALGGTNTYSGFTDIQAGTLQVNGSLGNTAVTVESGATLGGTGTITGAVTVLSGGILSPGDAPGTLTVGALTLNSGSNSNYQLGASGVIGSGVNDLTVVTGALTLGGTLNITNAGGFGPGAYQLFQYNTLTNNGLAIGTVPVGYTSSNFIVVTGIAKEVDLIVVPNGPATAQFWDGTTTTGDGHIHGGSGTWSNFTTTNFTTNSGATNSTWQNGIAVFGTPFAGAGSSTVTLSGAINFAGLMFMGNGYTIVSNGAAGTSFTAIGTPTNSTNIADISTSTGVTATINAVIGGSAGISKSGVGTLILSGVNTYSGGTTINLGVLSIGISGALSSGPVSINGGGELNAAVTTALSNEVLFGLTGDSTVSAAAGAVFTLNAVALTGGNAVFGSAVLGGAQNTGVVAIGSLTAAVVNINSTIEVAYGTLQNAGGVTNLGNLTALVASTTVDTFGTLDVHDNSMEIANFRGSGHVTLGSSASTILTVDAGSFSGIISGAGQLKSTGALTLTGANSYSGGTAITAGTLTLGDGVTTGAALGTNAVTISGMATLTLDLANGETFSNSVTDNGHVVAEGVGITISGGGATLQIGPSNSPTNNPFTIASVISGSGDFTMNGANMVTVTGANSYQGGTFINSGVVQLGDGVTAHAALGTNTVTISSGAGLELDLAKGETFSNAVTNNGYLITYGAANNYTISGPISGMGGFYQYGSNVVTLTGNNSYKGGTVITTGTLLVNNTTGSGTGSGAVTVYGGTLGGSGAIAGAVTLNSGGTIAPGAGSLGVAGTKLSAASLTWNGGGAVTLQLGGAASDQVALTGALTKGAGIGGYTLNISNAGITQADYTLATFGSTTFVASDFTLALPTGFSGSLLETSSSLSLLLAIGASGPVIQNSNPVGTPLIADFTVTGPVVTGTATQSNTINSLIFTPGGALTIYNTLTLTSGKVSDGGGLTSITGGTLAGPNGLFFDIIGQMIVDSELQGNLTKTGTGSLILNGALFGNAQVLAGLLGGTGSISGNLYNNGTVAPGDAPGALSVAGNYTQTHTASLVIGIGGSQAGQFDALAVGGKASLDGTLQLVRLNNFTLQRGEVIPFLTAGQGITGTFSTVIDSLVTNTILQPEVVYGPNGVSVVAEQGSFKTFAENSRLPGNEISVGGALDSLVSNPRANALINYLDGRSLSDLAGDLEKIEAEQLTSMFTVGIALANVQSMNIQRRADDIRSGASGFSAAGFAMNGASPGYSGGFDITSGVAGPSGPDGKESEETTQPAAPIDQRWGAFLSGTGQWVNVGDTNNARGYNIDSGGFTLGVDYKASEHFAVGLSFGYTGTTSDLADRGRIFVNGGKMGIYTTTFFGGWYADAAVNGGYNSYATHRSGLMGQASGSPDGGELNGVFGTGYDFKKGALTFGPTATFNYTYVGVGDFTEVGSLAPLNIHSGDEESLRTAVGFKVKYDWKVGGLLIKPELRAAWQHEFGDTTYSLDSNFADGGSAFTVSGPKIGRDSALLSGGFAVQLSERSSTYVYYDGELGRANYHSSSVSAGFRVEF